MTTSTTDSSSESFAVAAVRSAALEERIVADPGRFRVLTGDRPTEPLHLGHYFGTLANRVRLQRAGVEVFLVIADTRSSPTGTALVICPATSASCCWTTSRPASTRPPRRSSRTAPCRLSTQLMLPFLSLVSVAELHRNPTVKAEAEAAGTRALSGLLLTYPVHQAADILFCHANLVPVGRDQLPHLETTRSIARRFNDRYAAGADVFSPPDALLTRAPALRGTDGTKMSKSRRNTIDLRATEDQTAQLLRRAKTDAERNITYEPQRRPEVANLLLIAALCGGADPAELGRLPRRPRSGSAQGAGH